MLPVRAHVLKKLLVHSKLRIFWTVKKFKGKRCTILYQNDHNNQTDDARNSLLDL